MKNRVKIIRVIGTNWYNGKNDKLFKVKIHTVKIL